MIPPNWQPTLTDDLLVLLRPLQQEDFEPLFNVASDPLIWEQHPNPDRYQYEVFLNYFKGAMESGSALLVLDKQTGTIAGCTRFYDHEPEESQVKIGYTFFSRACWGKGYNPVVKKLMTNYAFQFVDTIIFHVGVGNKRSRIAMERLGAEGIGEEEVAYFGEAPKRNIIFQLTRKNKNR